MILEFKNKKIQKQCENPSDAQKVYGAKIGNKLTLRVTQLIAAQNLSDIKHIPAARLHKLSGKRANEYAVDLVHPFRLVFTPVFEDGNETDKLESINIVRIEEVTDYHGKQKCK